ncbi:MAG: divergent polysaccharide deacetylase family protein, partial [Thermodesulfobacteriota bacterium]
MSWVMFLTWCTTLLMGGGMGALSQGLYRTYRAESVGGSNDLAAVPYQPREQRQTKPEKMAAIVIDDLGLDLKMARKFWELEIPVTLAILPYQRHSRRVAREAILHGKEVILHLPLQPRDFPAVNPGTGALLLSMDREQIQAEVAQQLDALPGCVGVSNHM